MAVPKILILPKVPVVQGSLLDLFAQQKLERLERGAAVERLEPRAQSANPFAKQYGQCTHHAHADEPSLRLYWCHACNCTGCMDWLKAHKD